MAVGRVRSGRCEDEETGSFPNTRPHRPSCTRSAATQPPHQERPSTKASEHRGIPGVDRQPTSTVPQTRRAAAPASAEAQRRARAKKKPVAHSPAARNNSRQKTARDRTPSSPPSNGRPTRPASPHPPARSTHVPMGARKCLARRGCQWRRRCRLGCPRPRPMAMPPPDTHQRRRPDGGGPRQRPPPPPPPRAQKIPQKTTHDPATRKTPVLQLAGAKSRTYAPDGTCTRLSVLRIAGYGTVVLPSVAPPYSGRGLLFRLSFSSVSVLILWRRPRPAPPRLVRHLNLGVSLES